MKNTRWIVVLVGLTGCVPCNTVIIDNGPIPEAGLTFVPYQDGQVYQFRHSGGLVINFIASRETRKEQTWCEECCKYEYQFEVNSTRLSPDYPIFDFYFEISNQDTSCYNCYAATGKYGFYIPTHEDQQSGYCEKVDSLMINSIYYHNVFKLKSGYGSSYDRDSIYADSLFYNFENGILKILMSNGESYTID